MSSENQRQREVHRYYQSWLDSSIGFDATPSNYTSRYHADGSQLRVSKDKALIAFAQLGCLRLDVKRSIVTLISTDQQYILAEATKTLSLVSGDGDYEVQDGIWFGNASLPRAQGISGDALAPPSYTAIDIKGSSYTAPALVVDDLRVDERYRSKPYVGQGVTFYCGVPISTESGIPIGVYTVTDDKPRDGLRPSELRFMHDMAATVMRHLDVISGEAARFRGETMVTGMGRFISGAHSLHEDTPLPTGYSTQATSPDLNSNSASSTRDFKGMTITAATPSKLRSAERIFTSPPNSNAHKAGAGDTSNLSSDTKEIVESDSNSTLTDAQSNPKAVMSEAADKKQQKRHRSRTGQRSIVKPETIFSRAAKILQECIAAEGVLFFDAALTNLAQQSNISTVDRSNTSSSNILKQQDSSEGIADDSLQCDRKTSVNSVYSGGSEESDNGAFDGPESKMCKLLGYALDETALLLPGMGILENLQITERSLSRLVKMYPDGKLFSFHSGDDLTTSDSKHLTEDNMQAQRNSKAKISSATVESRRIPRAIASEIERLVPHAKSIVWLPLWDLSKQRWSAGLFLWSSRPDRLVAAHDDLLYLKVFANSIMVEVARLDAAIADTAKSTFIANISHELRTPLHGILGNLDILQDTKLTEFQHSLLTAIEVCGRTLSDTIDHVLEFSKINQLSRHHRRRTKSSSIPLPLLTSTSPIQNQSSYEEDFDLAAVVEEAVEAASASYAFQFSGRSRLRASSIHGDQSQRSPNTLTRKGQKVHVIIDIEHRKSWKCRSQPSAIRRVVTNLLGNALKYTEEGTIHVTLTFSKFAQPSHPDAGLLVLLSIKDTGKGMSEDFVRNHAFTPFSQESQFSTGTGLGLSIVQQIVKSLGGRIELESTQNVGTEMRIFLHLPPAQQVSTSTSTEAESSRVSGTANKSHPTVRVMKVDASGTTEAAPGLSSVIASLEEMLQTWFGLSVQIPESQDAMESSIMLYATSPTPEQLVRDLESTKSSSQREIIVLASDAIEKADLTERYSVIEQQNHVHVNVLSYPIGPQKLGRAISRCLGNIKMQESSEPIEETSTRPRSLPNLESLEYANQGLSIEDKQVKIRNERETSTPPQNDQPSTPKVTDADPTPGTSKRISRMGSIVNADEAIELHQLNNKRKSSVELSSSPRKLNPPRRPPAVMPRSLSAPNPVVLEGETSSETAINVLLVDDNDINLTILKTCMKRARIPYDFAKDGLQAVNLFEQAYNINEPFTHVLMDINMPVMDGIQATREIREFERRQNNLQRISSRTSEAETPTASTTETSTKIEPQPSPLNRAFVIALSGVASETTQLEMMEVGADMFLAKPVKLKELVAILASP